MLLTTPLAYGPPDRCCPGVTSLENSRSTVELQADGRRATRLKISSPSRILDSRAYGGLALRSGRPTLPGWASPSDLCRSSPIFKCGARQRAAASWLRGPAGADGFLSPLVPPTDPHGSVGTTKKPPRPFGRGGCLFSPGFTSFDHRPRARLFDGSIPGGLVARRRGIRTHEQRPGLPMEDLSRRWPLISDAGS